MAAAAAYGLSLSSLLSSSSSSSSFSNSKKAISSSLSFLLPQTPMTSSLSIQPLSPLKTPRRPSTTVLFAIPTAKPDRAPADKIPKWSARSIRAFALGELEALKLHYTNTGTESLLMGILVEGTSEAAKFLRANGITFFNVRDETVKLLGKASMLWCNIEHAPLTEPAQRALDWAVDEKMKSGESGEITVAYILLGIWAQKDSAGHIVLATLGFNDEKASELAKNVSKDAVMKYLSC